MKVTPAGCELLVPRCPLPVQLNEKPGEAGTSPFFHIGIRQVAAVASRMESQT